MDVHHYHPDTGEYLGGSPANLDPLDRGRHVLPAHATFVAPPTVPEGFSAVWDGESWQAVRDLRGKTVYGPEGQVFIMDSLGELPDGYSEARPEPKAQTKDDLLSQLEVMKQQYLKERYPDDTIKWLMGHQMASLMKPGSIPQSHLDAIEQAWDFINGKIVDHFFAIGGKILSGEMMNLEGVDFTILDTDDPHITVAYVRGLS